MTNLEFISPNELESTAGGDSDGDAGSKRCEASGIHASAGTMQHKLAVFVIPELSATSAADTIGATAVLDKSIDSREEHLTQRR